MVLSWLREKFWGKQEWNENSNILTSKSNIPGKMEPGETVELKCGKTHYFLQGPIDDPTAPLVVLLHGASVFSFIWGRFSQIFVSRGYRVLSFDFYGHGYSAVPNVAYTKHLYREQLEQLMEYLDLFPKPLNGQSDENYVPPLIELDENLPIEDQIPPLSPKTNVHRRNSHDLYLMGHSMGGLVASEFAAKHRNIITKVVLFNSAGMPLDINVNNTLPYVLHHIIRVVRRTELLDKPAHLIGQSLKWIGHKMNFSYEDICNHAFTLDEEPHLYLESDLQKPVLENKSFQTNNSFSQTKSFPLVSRLVLPPLIPAPLMSQVFSTVRFAKSLHFLMRTWLYQLTLAQRSSVLLSIVRNFPLLDADTSQQLLMMGDIPILIFWGDEDGLLPAYLMDKFKKNMPHAIVVKIPGADHAAFLQKPAFIFNMMFRFMNNQLQETIQGDEENLQFFGDSVLLIKP